MSSRLPGLSRPSSVPRLLRVVLIGGAVLVAVLVLSPFTAVPNGHRGVKLTFVEEATGARDTFVHEDGIVAYLNRLVVERKERAVHDTPFTLARDGRDGDTRVDLAL